MKDQNCLAKRGFTLAEVLITLAVIGIIAAITVPALLQNTNDAQYKTAWKKKYSEIAQIQLNIKREKALPLDTIDDVIAAIDENISYVKKCTNSTTGGCWHKANEWKDYADNVLTNSMTGPGYVLNDGSLMYILTLGPAWAQTENKSLYGTNNVIDAFIDVNGFRPPNKGGVDIFGATIMRDRTSPEGAPDSYAARISPTLFCRKTAGTGDYLNGVGCSAKVLKE